MKKILLTLAILCSFSFNNFAQSITHYVNSGNYYYTPNSLTINEGDTVVWINDGGFHNVNADINTLTGSSFNNPVAFLSSPTSNTTLHTFIFTVPGTYNYDCSVGSHALNGMVGSLIVNALPIPGCTDPLALNYDANATIDDGSCIYPSNSIYDIVANSNDHNTLELAIDTCGLTATLQGAGTFTLFAPTDAAFNALPQGTIAALLNDLPQLTDILKHHVVGDSVMSGMLSNNQIVTTLLGDDVTVTINTNGDVFIDNAQVIVADIVADNGVVHVIDAVLIPTTPANNTVYDIIDLSPSHTTLKTAIDACGLDGTLKGAGPFTVFAPTDAAFNALPAGTIAALLNDLPQLTDILKHHVVGANVLSGSLSNNQIVTTLLGTDVTVTINSNGDVFIDNAQVIVADIVADNGVVHVIDAVLLPASTLVSEINELNNKYLHSVNILGEKISRDVKNQIVLDIYSNGNIIKRFTR